VEKGRRGEAGRGGGGCGSKYSFHTRLEDGDVPNKYAPAARLATKPASSPASSSRISSFFSSLMSSKSSEKKEAAPASPRSSSSSRSASPAPPPAPLESDDDSGDESFSDSELEASVTAPSSVSHASSAPAAKSPRSVTFKDKEKKGKAKESKHEKRKGEKTNVNVFKLDLSQVTVDGQVMTGDPVFCGKCSVSFSHLSKMVTMPSAGLQEKNAKMCSKYRQPAYAGVRDLFLAPEDVPTPSPAPINAYTSEITDAVLQKAAAQGAILFAASSASASSSSSTTTTTTSTTTTAPSTMDKQDYSNLPEEVSVWTCEFCGFHNISSLDEEELPRTDPVDYVISPAPA
jgi:hypothetical protein